MKISIIILNILFLTNTAHAQLELQKQTQGASATSTFTAKITSKLQVEEMQSYVDLGTLVPGSTIKYEGPINSMNFKISGQPGKGILLEGNIFTESKDASLEGIKWQYWDGHRWQDMEPFSTGNEDKKINFFNQVLGQDGEINIRVYPNSLVIDDKAETGSLLEFKVTISCDYGDF